jgi:DNA-binding MarR family transcriptional regulator
MRTNTDDPLPENLGFLLAKASQRINARLSDRFAASGFAEIRPSYGSVLVPLFEQDDSRMGELAERALLSKSSMTALVRDCEQAGLVERRPDPHDRRAFRVRLTRRGRRFQSVAEQILADLDAEVIERLGRRRHQALMQALKGVVQL